MVELPGEGLFPDGPLEVLVDGGGEVRLQGVAFGPAGAIVVDGPDHSTWAVDHAIPDQLVGYEPADPTVDGGAFSRDDLLVALVGAERAMVLGDVLDRRRDVLRLGGVSDPHDLDPPDHLYGGRGSPVGRGRPTMPTPTAELLVLLDVSTDVELPPLGRIAAGLDLLGRAERVRGGALLAPLRGRVADALLVALAEIDRADVAALDPRLVAELGRMVAVAAELGPGIGGSLRDLRRWIEEFDVPVRASRDTERLLADAMFDSAVDPHLDAPLFADAARSRLSAVRTVGRPVIDSDVERVSPVLFDVRTDDPRAVGRWIVLRRTEGLVHIGHAPVEVGPDGRLGALIAVPPDLRGDDCAVLLVEGSELEPGGSSPLRSVRDAVRAGRDACRLERLDRRFEARTEWERCSHLWATAGDRPRALLAAEHAEWGSPAGLLPASLSDAIVADAILAEGGGIER